MANFRDLREIELPAAFDAHVHLRDGEMSQLVTPTIREGGVNQVYVMVSPNVIFVYMPSRNAIQVTLVMWTTKHPA